jgi:hypothetical protein
MGIEVLIFIEQEFSQRVVGSQEYHSGKEMEYA